jgi:predicted component of type VI protein secretion system
VREFDRKDKNRVKGLQRILPGEALNLHPLPPNPKRRRLASDWLVGFYNARPKRLAKLLMRLVREAESGKNTRYLEILLNLLEGPSKEGNDTTFNFNFLSDGDRQRAEESVKRIQAMRQKSITLLPEKRDETTELQPAGSSREGNAEGRIEPETRTTSAGAGAERSPGV